MKVIFENLPEHFYSKKTGKIKRLRKYKSKELIKFSLNGSRFVAPRGVPVDISENFLAVCDMINEKPNDFYFNYRKVK